MGQSNASESRPSSDGLNAQWSQGFRGCILRDDAQSMLMLKSIRLTENMVTFVKKRTSLGSTMMRGEEGIRKRLSAADVLDDCNPTRMPVQAVERGIRSPSPNTSGEVLPLPSVNSLSIDVVSLAAYDTDLFVGKMDSRKIVEEMYSIERIHLFWVRLVHDCRVRRRGSTTLISRQASGLILNMRACMGVVIVCAMRPRAGMNRQ